MKITFPDTHQSLRPGKLICIGRNYAKHASEMSEMEFSAGGEQMEFSAGGEQKERATSSEPLVFLKPATALIGDGGLVQLPPRSAEVHHEVELVAVIGRGGRHISEGEALDHVAAYAVGLDVTARDVQAAAKERGYPWSVAKGFDTFAPLGPLAPAAEVDDVQNLEIRLTVNGEERQRGRTRDMLFSVAALVVYCSTVFTLERGDLLYTGTPEGVGPLRDGDQLEATATGLPSLRVAVQRAM